jgi:hypothetical protein
VGVGVGVEVGAGVGGCVAVCAGVTVVWLVVPGCVSCVPDVVCVIEDVGPVGPSVEVDPLGSDDSEPVVWVFVLVMDVELPEESVVIGAVVFLLDKDVWYPDELDDALDGVVPRE